MGTNSPVGLDTMYSAIRDKYMQTEYSNSQSTMTERHPKMESNIITEFIFIISVRSI